MSSTAPRGPSRPSACHGATRPRSAWSRSARTGARSRRSLRNHRTRQRCLALQMRHSRRWATMSSRPTCSSRRCDIMPMLVRQGRAQAYDFMTNKVPGATQRDAGYWRDVGTLDSYFDAHMDLCASHPVFNLYNEEWPIYTHVPSEPPAKFVHDSGDRLGRAINSLVSNGVVVSGGLVRECVLSPGARVNSWATVERSIVLHNTIIGRHAVVRDAILDKNVTVPEGVQVGVDKDHDKARGFVVSEGGITVVGKGQKVTA